MPAETVNFLRSNRRYRDLPPRNKHPFLPHGFRLDGPFLRGHRSHRMVRYACSPRGARIGLHSLAGDLGVAYAINKTCKPTGRFCDFHEYIADRGDHSHYS